MPCKPQRDPSTTNCRPNPRSHHRRSSQRPHRRPLALELQTPVNLKSRCAARNAYAQTALAELSATVDCRNVSKRDRLGTPPHTRAGHLHGLTEQIRLPCNRSAKPGRWRRSSVIQVCSPNAVCPTLWAVVRSPIRSSCSRPCSVNRTESCRAGPRMACLSPAALRGASRTRTQAPRAPRLRQPTTGGGLRKACLRGVSCRTGIGVA